MATTKAAAPTVDVAKQLKAAVGVFATSQKELARKDKTITKLQALVAKLEAKKAGGVAPAVKNGRKAASATDADAPVAKRVKASAAPAATEAPKKRGPKAAAAAPVAAEPKKRGPKPKAAAAAPVVAEAKKRGPKPKAAVEAAAPVAKKGKKSSGDDDFLV